ncbi:hypothetical protein [Brevibacillus nitrificans]|uniref:hypothetical protein n=1 Tax=Brevibacillus nitrificans TaxID=651560 RepID=UPI0026361F30|nr:hypothetical protein [Brevibacillus nitrificans]
MEYRVNSGTWTNIAGITLEIANANIGDRIQVRVKASGSKPASAAQTITVTAATIRPAAAPTVVFDDTADTITLQSGWEFNTGSGWVAFDGSNTPVVTGSVTVQVRVAQTSTKPASEIQTITFTP